MNKNGIKHLKEHIVTITFYLNQKEKMKDINTILNKTAVISEELNDFITLMQKDKEGKKYSHTELQNMFLLYKITSLNETIYKLEKNINFNGAEQ